MTNTGEYNLYASDPTLKQKAKEQARRFILKEGQFHLGFLPTEQSHPYTRDLSEVILESPEDGLKLILDVDRDLPSVARRVFLSESFKALCSDFEKAARDNRRVCFTGCGSTGRLSMILEEMWRQFWEDRAGVKPGDTVRMNHSGNKDLEKADLACSIMTGGDRALIRAVENFEDYEAFGARQVQDLHLRENDLLIAISEGGETSSVLGTLREGLKRGCRVYFAFNNPSEILSKHLERCQTAISAEDVTILDLYTGSMALSGSTRMQATTMEMLVIGTAMEIGLIRSTESENAADPLSYADHFALLIKNLSSRECLKNLATFALEEQRIYKNGGRITYFASSYLLDIFSDTTERSPTFMLPPFRAGNDKSSAVSWAFAKDPLLSSTEAWIHMLRRKPRGLNWTREDYLAMDAVEYSGNEFPKLDEDEISLYSIGNEEDHSRSEADPYLYLYVYVDQSPRSDATENTKNIIIGNPVSRVEKSGDIHIHIDLDSSPINLWKHLAVKLIFNTVSTGTMAMMGRIKQNWMIQLDPTNKKLIDRGSRIIAQLLNISYERACQELHLSLLARERFLSEGGQTTISPVEAALRRLGES